MASSECIVHSHKNVTKFHTAVNQLRRENIFSNDVYQELPKRCCSCKGKKGLKSIDVNILREVCKDVALSLTSTLKFRFSSKMNELLIETEEEENENNQSSSDTTDDEGSQAVQITSFPRWPIAIGRGRTSGAYYPTNLPAPRWHPMGNSAHLAVDDQLTSSNQENTADKFLKALETFKVITVTDECIVHNSKYQSKFNNAVNIIRRGKTYEKYVYHELPKRCCSCNGKTGLNVIDINVLISMCDEIASDQSKKPISNKSFTLSFEPGTRFEEYGARVSRFIGKQGRNLKPLQDKYNVCVVVTHKYSNSNKRRSQRRIKLANNTKIQKIINADELYVSVRRKDKLMTDAIPFDEIQQELTEKWKETSEIRFIEREFSFDQTQSKKCFQFVSLSFESALLLEERRNIMGRFIGKQGENFLNLENQYNIRLHIINNESSNEKYFRKLIEAHENNPDNFYLFITKKNKSIIDEIPIDEVKQRIIQQWNKANIEYSDLDKSFHFLSLSFESIVSPRGRRIKIGQFIGKNGQHLRDLKKKYDIQIYILDRFSRMNVQKKFAKIQAKDKWDKLNVLITNKNKSTMNNIPIDHIKQKITHQWENPKKTTSHNYTRSSELDSDPMLSAKMMSADRWNQKKKYRHK